MPIYTYKCEKCGHRFDQTQKITDKPVKECEQCGSPVKRVFHPVGIIFKGSGFYKTDYADKGQEKPAASDNGDSPSKDKSESEVKKSDAKKVSEKPKATKS